jgi:hypothetical protein
MSHDLLLVASLETAVTDDSGGVMPSTMRFPVEIFVPYLVLPAARGPVAAVAAGGKSCVADEQALSRQCVDWRSKRCNISL